LITIVGNFYLTITGLNKYILQNLIFSTQKRECTDQFLAAETYRDSTSQNSHGDLLLGSESTYNTYI